MCLVTQANISIIVNIEKVRTYNLTLPQWVLNQYQLLDNGTNNVTEEEFEEFGQYSVGFELLSDSKLLFEFEKVRQINQM